MKKFYKICVCLVVGLLGLALSFSNARSKFWTDIERPKVTDPKFSGDVITGSISEWTTYETDKLEWILQFPERTDYATPLWYALALVKIAVNWILGILSTIALIYMLYCGFLVFSSWASDNNAKKGRKWISTAAIALAWIGLSWLIISAMIWFIGIVSVVD